MRDYSPKGKLGNAVKFTIESEKWHPVDPACLGFDAMIKECSNPDHTRVGGMTLTADRKLFERECNSGEKWPGTMVGRFDSFQFTTRSVMVSGIALLDPTLDIKSVGNLEGVTFEELPT